MIGIGNLVAQRHDEQFVSDLIQGGAGPFCNMNANEMIANIGLQKMGYKKGDYVQLSGTMKRRVHPILFSFKFADNE